ncbi:MAG: LysM peptidoglycan-binding protein [Cohnella sp.]|nr:LysM peptidoglycan-binding protein [Cohnella sp.]
MRTFASEQRIEPASASEQVLSVDTGDTLWTLAASVKKDSMDIRDAVHQIMKRNGLTSSALSSGQDLVVPDTILP